MPTEIERLYREHRAGLVRLVERELRDRHEAEDVVQTAFLDAQRALERGTIPRYPRAWLAAIALNAARRLRRRRLNAEPLEDFAAHEAAEVSEIRAALTSLPQEQRAAVLYTDVLGLSYDETAERMGKSVNAVTMLLHRGRRRLRQSLGVTVGGFGSWRWLKRAGMPQMAAAKGAAGILVAAGLATTGIVVARVVAPIGTGVAAAQVTRPASPKAGAARGGERTMHLVRRHSGTTGGSRRREAVVSMRGSSGDATTGSSGDATTRPGGSSTAGAVALRLPTASLPTLPKLPTTVAATVTVATPITTVALSTPTGTAATVTTPITTVTVPLP